MGQVKSTTYRWVVGEPCPRCNEVIATAENKDRFINGCKACGREYQRRKSAEALAKRKSGRCKGCGKPILPDSTRCLKCHAEWCKSLDGRCEPMHCHATRADAIAAELSNVDPARAKFVDAVLARRRTA